MRETTIDKYGKCPNCGANWDAGEIYENFLAQKANGNEYWKTMTNEEIKKQIEENYSPPYRFSRLMGIYDDRLDKTVMCQCPDCNKTWYI